MTIYGYGEDFLTLWAVKHKMPDIIEEIEEEPYLNKPLVIYRPSFGRGGALSTFGEFDLIFATKKIYLVESKWEQSSEVKGPQGNRNITISDIQQTRHEIFKWYLIQSNEYLNHDFNTWDIFRDNFNEEFGENFQYEDTNGNIRRPVIPKKNSILANNIYNVSNLLSEQTGRPITAKMIEDILLYFYSDEINIIAEYENLDFQMVQLQFQPIENGYLINIQI